MKKRHRFRDGDPRTDLSGFGLVQSQGLATRRNAALESPQTQLVALRDSEITIDVGRQGGFHYKAQLSSTTN